MRSHLQNIIDLARTAREHSLKNGYTDDVNRMLESIEGFAEELKSEIALWRDWQSEALKHLPEGSFGVVNINLRRTEERCNKQLD